MNAAVVGSCQPQNQLSTGPSSLLSLFPSNHTKSKNPMKNNELGRFQNTGNGSITTPVTLAIRRARLGILAICISIVSATFARAADPLVQPGPGALTNTASQNTASAGSQTQKQIHPALLEALREHRHQLPQSEAMRVRSHLIPRASGRVLVNINASVTDSVLTNIQQSGGLIVNTFPQSQTIFAEIPIASLETIANLTGVTNIQPTFFADSEESATNALHSISGPAVNGVQPRHAE